jgi:protein-S-isoprenylcysteine O-methyltransferase Ste14
MNEVCFRAAFWVLIGLLLAIRAVSSWRVRRAGERLLPDREAVAREGKGVFIGRVAAFFLLIGWIVCYALNPPWVAGLRFPLPAWLRWLGFILGLGSLGLLAWTQVALGRQWSAQLQLRAEHHLVTTGPYARVRHPLYTAMFGLGAGFALLTANWVFALMAAVVVAGLMARVGKEERMMIALLGSEYTEYMRRTGRFLPRLGGVCARARTRL